MKWLDNIVDKVMSEKQPQSEIVVSSGVSPSGAYHLGTLREIMTAEAVARELRMRGRTVRHVHFSDDYDVFRKVPADIPDEYEKYLGMPLSDIPSPFSDESYADYYVSDLVPAAKGLHIDMEIMRAHQKYNQGFFTEAIETALDSIEDIRSILEDISGRKLDPNWSPIQVLENGRLKNRKFISIDKENKLIRYLNSDGNQSEVAYNDGSVKLNWRIDWPARWSILGVDVEPFGRDHATKGGSFDTGKAIVSQVFGAQPPLPLPYNFINKAGDTKKMSKSKGDSVTAVELLNNVPAEVVWFFMLRYAPDKLLFFDTEKTLISIFDDFSSLLSNTEKTEQEEHLLRLCLYGVDQPTVSRVPFTHLYVSYQASHRDVDTTLDVIRRSEYSQIVDEDEQIIRRELKFIDNWLDSWAPDELKFELKQNLPEAELSDLQKQMLGKFSNEIRANDQPDAQWYHQTIHGLRAEFGLDPKEAFEAIYQSLLSQSYGPKAGWFLSTIDRHWLVDRFEAVSEL